MSELNNTGVETTNQSTPAPNAVPDNLTPDEARAWESPMLSRNAHKEGVPPQEPEQEAEPQVKVPEPTQVKEEATDKQSKKQVDASTINMLDNFQNDPQFKPIAMYLDTKLEGVDTDRAFAKAIEYGDVGLIDRAYLVEKLGDGADEVINLSTSLFEAAQAKATAQVNEVYQQFGGHQVVSQAVKYFNEKGSSAERKVLGSLLDSGVKENVQYAMERIVSFAKQSGGVVSNNNAIPMGQPGYERGLSADEYREALRKVTSGSTRPSEAVLSKLANARKLGKQQGL